MILQHIYDILNITVGWKLEVKLRDEYQCSTMPIYILN